MNKYGMIESKDELIKTYPDFKDLINDYWGDEDMYGDNRTVEEMAYNIELKILDYKNDNLRYTKESIIEYTIDEYDTLKTILVTTDITEVLGKIAELEHDGLSNYRMHESETIDDEEYYESMSLDEWRYLRWLI